VRKSGTITFAVSIIATTAAMGARETYRIHLHDLGHPEAMPVEKRQYNAMRTHRVADAEPAGP